ncbi:hypothetical protein M8J77_021471 [Diaphorina citri]|nr:hypothetical protein M8J77_021471 [Diaphorina citri]
MLREYPLAIDDKGCVIQVSLAEKAVRCSRTVMGLKSENGIILICSLDEAQQHSMNRVIQISGNMIAAGTGFPGDILFLMNKAHIIADKYKLNFQQDMPLDEFVEEMADLISLNTILKSARPYRACLIVAGWDASAGYQVYVINPDGQSSKWSAVAIGKDAVSCKSQHEKQVHTIQNMSLNMAKKLGVDIYLNTVSKDVNSMDMVWLKSVDNSIQVSRVSPSEIEAIAQGKM